jgi:hypothetical protein
MAEKPEDFLANAGLARAASSIDGTTAVLRINYCFK